MSEIKDSGEIINKELIESPYSIIADDFKIDLSDNDEETRDDCDSEEVSQKVNPNKDGKIKGNDVIVMAFTAERPDGLLLASRNTPQAPNRQSSGHTIQPSSTNTTQPPTLPDSIEDFLTNIRNIEYDPQRRNRFIIFILCCVFVMLLATESFVAIVSAVPAIKDWFRINAVYLIFPTLMFIIAINYVMTWVPCVKHPVCGFVGLFLPVVSMSVFSAMLTSYYSTKVILYAFVATAAVVLLCIVLAFTNFDFTSYAIYVIVIFAVFFVIGFIIIYLRTVTQTTLDPAFLILLIFGTLLQVLRMQASKHSALIMKVLSFGKKQARNDSTDDEGTNATHEKTQGMPLKIDERQVMMAESKMKKKKRSSPETCSAECSPPDRYCVEKEGSSKKKGIKKTVKISSKQEYSEEISRTIEHDEEFRSKREHSGETSRRRDQRRKVDRQKDQIGDSREQKSTDRSFVGRSIVYSSSNIITSSSDDEKSSHSDRSGSDRDKSRNDKDKSDSESEKEDHEKQRIERSHEILGVQFEHKLPTVTYSIRNKFNSGYEHSREYGVNYKRDVEAYHYRGYEIKAPEVGPVQVDKNKPSEFAADWVHYMTHAELQKLRVPPKMRYNPRVNGFVQLVLIIQFLCVAFTLFACATFKSIPSLQKIVILHNVIWIPACLGVVATVYTMLCSACARVFPLNYIMLFINVLSMTMMCGYVTLYHNTFGVIIATTCILIILIFFILMAVCDVDFSKFGVIVVALLLGIIVPVIVYSILLLIKSAAGMQPTKTRHYNMMILGIATYSTSMIFMLQLILKNRTMILGDDDYPTGALILYMCEICMFMKLVAHLGLFDENHR